MIPISASFALPPSGAVSTSGPASVTATECSQCEDQVPPPTDPNVALRAEAYRTLDAVVGRLFDAAAGQVVEGKRCAC